MQVQRAAAGSPPPSARDADRTRSGSPAARTARPGCAAAPRAPGRSAPRRRPCTLPADPGSTRVPKPAATRKRGIEVEPMHPVPGRHDRRAVGVAQHAGHERVPAAVERRRDDRIGIAQPRELLRQVDEARQVLPAAAAGTARPTCPRCPVAAAARSSAGAARRRAAARRPAPACRAAGRWRRGSCTSMSRMPTRGSTGFGLSSRTSVSKSPLAPVRNDHRW